MSLPRIEEELRVSVLAAALDYAAQGQPVFPCSAAHAGGREPKEPLVRWRQRASTDPERIAAWWAWLPHAIGLPTGLRHDVLDIDRKPGRPNGYAALNALDKVGLVDGVARWVTTPSGGCHAYFPAGTEPIANASFERFGVDLRGLGGFVIAPPSYIETNRYSGFYLLEGPRTVGSPLDWRGVEALLRPERSRRHVEGRREAGDGPRVAHDPAGLLAALTLEVAHAEPGGRNHTLFVKACRAVEYGLDTKPLAEAGLAAGLSPREVDATIESATGTASGRHF